MENTISYKAGILLGKLARQIDNKIASFSKQYAGNISRRIATKDDFQKLLNFIQEKIVIHDVTYSNVRETATELNSLMQNFNEQKYEKDYAIAGFFHSYLMPLKSEKPENN